MATECNAERFGFGEVSGRVVVAGFDTGAITSDAGALMLGATDRTIQLTERFATCFADGRSAGHVEHDLRTLLLQQRVVDIALGSEDLVDHDQLRHDPVLAVLAGKLEARGAGCAPFTGKFALDRLELSRPDRTPRAIPDQPRSCCHRGVVRRVVPRRPSHGASGDDA